MKCDRVLLAIVALVTVLVVGSPVLAMAQEIVYGSNVAGTEDIWAVGVDGSAPINLSALGHDPNGDYAESEPYWSHDGTKIVFISDKSGCRNVWTMDADGLNDQNQTHSPFMELSPRWSPVGDKIFFARTDTCDPAGCAKWPRFEIFSLDLPAGGETQITFNQFRDLSPVVSPDGQSLAITRGENPNDCGNQTNLWKISADGVFEDQLDPAMGGNNGYYEWTGDWYGSSIVYAKQMGCSVGYCNEIVQIDEDGSGYTRITDNDYYDFPCGYSPDGESLLILSRRDGPYNFWTLNIADGTMVQLTADSSAKTCGDWKSGVLSPWVDVVPSAINPRSQGKIPVVIYSTQAEFDEGLEFDATLVDPLSTRLGRDAAAEAHQAGHLEDVDEDGDLDLVLHFWTQETGVQCGDTSLVLTGELIDGRPFEGGDDIRTVGCRAPRNLDSQVRRGRTVIPVERPGGAQEMSRAD